ncbi:MAG: hypothetical protein ACRD2T_14245, partial [Thermoanaerobaculia bacterium]
MSNRKKRVDEGTLPCNTEQDAWREAAPTSLEIKRKIHQKVDEVFTVLQAQPVQTLFDGVE